MVKELDFEMNELDLSSIRNDDQSNTRKQIEIFQTQDVQQPKKINYQINKNKIKQSRNYSTYSEFQAEDETISNIKLQGNIL